MPTIKAKIGGVWTPVGGSGGGGTDEVWVSADAPTGTTQELWYDTDEPNLYDPDTARWNSAWGVIQTGTFIPGQGTAVTSGTVITSALTTQAGVYRRYKITCFARAIAMSANATVTFNLLRDGAGFTDGYGNVMASSTPTPYSGLSCSWLVIGEAVARSWTVSLSAANTVTVAGFYGTHWYIEDVGPYYLASNPPAQPASVWTPLPWAANWGGVVGGFQQGSYRKVGDIVYVRGVTSTTATAGTTMATLPVGFRPPAQHMFATMQASIGRAGRIDLNTNGTLVIGEIVNAGAGQWVQLDGIQFSVTP